MTRHEMRRAWYQVHKWIGLILAVLGLGIVWNLVMVLRLSPEVRWIETLPPPPARRPRHPHRQRATVDGKERLPQPEQVMSDKAIRVRPYMRRDRHNRTRASPPLVGE